MESSSQELLIDNYEHVEECVLYSPVNVIGPGVNNALFDEQFEGCQCYSLCGPDCQCLKRCGSSYSEGCIDVDSLSKSTMVYECHENCLCNWNTCSNYVVQKGPHRRLQIFSTPFKGFGLRATADLKKGEFVCEYAGEVIGREEARKRFSAQRPGDRNYILALREYFGSNNMLMTIVDPTHIGNIGRYINHSCQPNLVMVPVRTDTAVVKLCLFAKQNIPSSMELSFDYAGNPDEPEKWTNPLDLNTCGVSRCYCGAPLCRGTLPFDPSLSDDVSHE